MKIEKFEDVIVKGSCGEVRSMIYFAYEFGYMSKEDSRKC